MIIKSSNEEKHWSEYLLEENKFLKIIYSKIPDLTKVRVLRARLDEDGPTFIMDIDLPRYADKPPDKWKLNRYNRTQIELEVGGIQNIELFDWSLNNIVDIKISQKEKNILINIKSNAMKVKLKGEYLFIRSVSGYQNGS